MAILCRLRELFTRINCIIGGMLTVPGDWTNCKETNEGRPKIILSFCRIPSAQWLNRLETSKNNWQISPKIPTILILSTINSKVECSIFYQRTLRMIVSAPALCTGDQATAGGCWCPEAGSGCWVSDVQPGLETRGRPKQPPRPHPRLATLRLETLWRLGSGGWCLASSHYLHPPASANERTGLGSRDLAWPIRGQCLTVCIIPAVGDQLSSPDGTQLHGRGQRLGLGE